MPLISGTFTECEDHNPAALAESRRRAGVARAQAIRDAEAGDDADWLWCDVPTFIAILERIEAQKGIHHERHTIS